MSPVRNYKITALYKGDKFINYFQSIKLACRYAEKYFNCSFSSLEKYKRTKDVSIIQIDVTTIEKLLYKQFYKIILHTNPNTY